MTTMNSEPSTENTPFCSHSLSLSHSGHTDVNTCTRGTGNPRPPHWRTSPCRCSVNKTPRSPHPTKPAERGEGPAVSAIYIHYQGNRATTSTTQQQTEPTSTTQNLDHRHHYHRHCRPPSSAFSSSSWAGGTWGWRRRGCSV